MTNKTPAIIATVATIILLIVLAIVSVLFEMLVLNGATEKQGTIALGLSIACNGLGTILLGIFAGKFTGYLITKLNWNKFVIVLIAVFLSILIGSGLSILSIIISIPLAGVR